LSGWKHARISVGVLGGLLAALAACTSTAPTPTASPTPTSTPTPFVDLHPALGEPFVLGLGHCAFIDADGYRITFSRVLMDDRCPDAAECASPGSGVVELLVRESAASPEQAYEIADGRGPASTNVGEYRIELTALEPRPRQDGGAVDYRVTLVVTAVVAL
jgi:hypothetical protein